MIKLSKLQEEHIILALLNDPNSYIISNGASRVVFELPKVCIEELGLDKGINYVVKIAMGKGGLAQCDTEIKVYQEYADEKVLAPIFAMGSIMLIMEDVDIDDNYEYGRNVDVDEAFPGNVDIMAALVAHSNKGNSLRCAKRHSPYLIDYEECWSDCVYRENETVPDEYKEITEEEFQDAKEIVYPGCFLYENVSSSSDCFQIGYCFSLKKYVVYDYGFDNDKDCWSQLTSSGDCMNFNNVGIFLAQLFDCIEVETDLWNDTDEDSKSIEEFINKVENAYIRAIDDNNYYDDDDYEEDEEDEEDEDEEEVVENE